MTRCFVAGLDLGQRNDFTALALLERGEAPREPLPGSYAPRLVPVYHLRQLDRVRQTSYEVVTGAAAGLLARPELRGQTTLVVDETGVGTAVSDMLRARDLSPVTVTITGGHAVTISPSGFRVPKQELVTTVAVLLEGRRLRIPTALPMADVLVAELQNFRVTFTPHGHARYGAGDDALWREGEHDDLVLAVALAAWHAERAPSRQVYVSTYAGLPVLGDEEDAVFGPPLDRGYPLDRVRIAAEVSAAGRIPWPER